MRTGNFWGIIAIVISAGAANAQSPPGFAPPPGLAPSPNASPIQGNYPAEMTIVQPEVEVRGGPAKQYYATSKLRHGDRVVVLRQSKDQPEWLAIKPPAGSFSWINGKYVKQIDAHNGYVQGDNNALAPVMPGSSVVEQTPNVESVKVPAGSLVVILDRPFNKDGEVWLPIQPPPTEVRYIPSEAVSVPAPSRAVTPAGGFPTSVGSGGDVMAQADQAYRTGNIDLARQLYRQAADRATDPTQRAYALNRLATMQQQPASGGAWQPGYAPAQNDLLRTTGSSTSKYAGTQPTSPPMVANQPPQWSGWGDLRKATFEKDGQPVYVLESRTGQPPLYVVAEPGKSLRDYVGRLVCLYGPITYSSDQVPRVQFMVAAHLALP